MASWLLAAGSFVLYGSHVGWTGEPPASLLDGTFLWLGVGLFVAPFARVLQVGTFFRFEREIAAVRADVTGVRDELRQSVAILGANLAATAAVRTEVNTFVGTTQGEIAVASFAGAKESTAIDRVGGTPRSAMELKVLRTLWVNQVSKFPELMPRFTFRLDAADAEAMAYKAAESKLMFEGLIGQTDDHQVFLTNVGLKECGKYADTFPLDAWFDPGELKPDQIAAARERIASLSDGNA